RSDLVFRGFCSFTTKHTKVTKKKQIFLSQRRKERQVGLRDWIALIPRTTQCALLISLRPLRLGENNYLILRALRVLRGKKQPFQSAQALTV
ncbi:MAG TPA: hypothetical protein VLN90_05890, partial [Thioalkalivibrio sp.]|nr:hypothetical protein [Thioalkalivibrio sp.]